ncbi:helix-turn-helix domain-containing protein [Vibrio taketomensis]|uniref:helix-turn-helix domain-containing protein n=1 Tax=Vibrio taketomensis TaxID=2572923 RepID=UPI001E4D6054|nr:helix-turn-helix domain-containing protein [Vibrio taketomensis]
MSHLGITPVKHACWAALLYFVSHITLALDSSPSVFYPLPTESQGRVFAANQLFSATNGGLWIHDVKGKLLFFDGQTVSPKWGSALPYSSEHLVVVDDHFWTYQDNKVYRSAANQQRVVAFELPPGTEVTKLGASNGYIWLTDEAHFHTYRIADGVLATYSIKELYHFSSLNTLAINDALLIRKRWVLATNVGVFVSEGEKFHHVARSKDSPIDKLYFSTSRRELVMGAAKGTIVYDLYDTSKAKYIIPTPNVTTINETTQSYWIGTQNGLYVYSFITGKIEKFTGEQDAGFALAGKKINALVNDNSSGMWVATNKDIHYFSLFGDKFERYSSQMLGLQNHHANVSNLIAMESKRGYWMLRNDGVYSLIRERPTPKLRVFAGRVNNLAESKGVLWLATNQGLIGINAKSGERQKHIQIPEALKNTPITQLAFDSKGILWIASDAFVWSFDVESGELRTIAEQWMSSNYAEGSLKNMMISRADKVLLGTDHGVYLLKDKQLKFIATTAKFGAVRNMIEGRDHHIWVASNYGVNIFDTNTEALLALPLVDEHVAPQCIVNNATGSWLTSSAGLSHYTLDGQLVGHYGQPFGLINNEFQNGFCLTSATDENTLLLGSWHSLISLNSRDLAVSSLPEANVLFSQVKINQKLIGFGSVDESKLNAPYGETITVQMGIMPSLSGSSLEFKLDNDKVWTPLEGYQIVMEGLMPGTYTLSVRPVVNGIEKGGIKTLTFTVTEPWYLTALAFATYATVGLLLLFGLVYWRSRMMSNANRKLKAQVALKTNQLRHQSRVLLSNNHQLRKQMQVRRLIFSQAIQCFRERLTVAEQTLAQAGEIGKNQVIDQIASELELLLNMREAQGNASPVYNMSMILNSTLDGWKEEFARAGLAVEQRNKESKDIYALLNYFNLDVLLNLVFDSLVKRCERNQTAYIELYSVDEKVVVQISDLGSPIDLDGEGSWQEIAKLIEISGGILTVNMSTEQNTVVMSWNESQAFDEHSVIEFDRISLKSTSMDIADPFVDRLEELVLEHYTDPDFSTSTAAKMLYVSERSLQRRFKAATQRTFSDYLAEVRLDNACRQLLAGGKVADIAFSCGFNDASYFSQRFKHRFGVSPTQFIEQSVEAI